MRNFNPRSREGSDAGKSARLTKRVYFNPRSREGSDQTGMTTIVAVTNFNPRSREGSDGRITAVDNGNT